MTDDLISSPQYWSVLAAAMIVFLALKYRPLDFKFFIVLPIAQRIAHTSMLPSSYLSSYIFALLTGVLLIVGYVLVDRGMPTTATRDGTSFGKAGTAKAFEVNAYIVLAGLFLGVYFTVKFLLYPQFFSALDYGERLQAQYDHRALFFLNLATPPALVAIVVRWTVNGRFNGWDKFLALIIFIGYMASGSKGSIAPILMIYFGIATYLEKEGTVRRAIWVVGALGIVGAGALSYLFPGMSSGEIANMIAYRIVANSEELEYLYVLNLQPGDYPFAGLGALFAPVAKALGENIEYTPGVWLYGQRFGNFTGYGPNAGFVIEFFGNLNYFGLIIPIIVGGTIAYCEKQKTLYRVVFLSMLPLLFAESLMFLIALSAHLVLLSGAKLLRIALVSRRPESAREFPATTPAINPRLLCGAHATTANPIPQQSGDAV